MTKRLRHWLAHNWELTFILVVSAAIGALYLFTDCVRTPPPPPPPPPPPALEIYADTVESTPVLIDGLLVGWEILSLPENGELYVWGVLMTNEQLPYTIPTKPIGPLPEGATAVFAMIGRKHDARDH